MKVEVEVVIINFEHDVLAINRHHPKIMFAIGVIVGRKLVECAYGLHDDGLLPYTELRERQIFPFAPVSSGMLGP